MSAETLRRAAALMQERAEAATPGRAHQRHGVAREAGAVMYQTSCTACGLDVNDLPDELGDRELIREQFFEFADDGALYCQGCAASGQGVFL